MSNPNTVRGPSRSSKEWMSEERRNGKPGRRKTDAVSDRLNDMEFAIGTMGIAIKELTDDFRNFSKDTYHVRRAERFTVVVNVIVHKIGRCLKRQVDNLSSGLRWLVTRLLVPGAVVAVAWHYYKEGKLLEWISHFWTP